MFYICYLYSTKAKYIHKEEKSIFSDEGILHKDDDYKGSAEKSNLYSSVSRALASRRTDWLFDLDLTASEGKE
jgi:hypothetical protein